MSTPTTFRSLMVAMALVSGVVSTAVSPVSAQSSIKAYTATLRVDGGAAAQSVTVTPGTHTFDFALANATKSPQAFGSAEIGVPSGVTVSSPQVLGTSYPNFSATLISGGTIILLTSTGPTGTGVAPGHSLTIEASVTVPSTAVCNAVWPIEVKQSNDFSGSGNDFLGNNVTTTVGTNHLVWTTQPGPTEYDKAMVPNPVVSAVDPCGVALTGSRTVTLTDAALQLASGASVTSTTGVFTFDNLKFSTYGFDDTLTAAASGFTSVTSHSFTVYQFLKTCDPGSTCSSGSLSDTGKTTFTSIDADSASTTDLLEVTVKGLASATAFPVCAATILTETGTSAVFYGSIVALDITNRGKTVTLTLPKTTVNAKPTSNGTPFFDICLSIPAAQQSSATAFTDKFGNTGVYEGLLPDCGTVAAPLPCVLSRSKNAANEIIQFHLPPGDPHYGWG